MNVLIASDSFKGSLSSIEAINAIAKGIKKVNNDIKITKLPIADGGEGTVDAFLNALKGKKEYVKVHNPLMRIIETYYGVLSDGTAIMEMEAASGLTLISEKERNPLYTTSFGTGELILDAINKGYKKIIIGIGGSATNDGGIGMAQALGVKFFDKDDRELSFGLSGKDLIKINRIDTSTIDKRIAETKIIIASDVTNKLIGENGATYVFGPQKGGNKKILDSLEEGMIHYASLINEDIKETQGSGAAGGLGAGLLYFCNGQIFSGIDLILDKIDFEKLLEDIDIVVTGEGRIDGQSIKGKVPVGIARRTKKIKNIPVIAIVGSIGEDAYKNYKEGIDAIFSITPGPIDLDDAMKNAKQYLEDLSFSIFKLINTYKGGH